MRFGVVGTGHWAEHVHLPGLSDVPGVERVGVWGRDPAKSAATAARFGIRPFTNFPDMLAEVDALSFAVPPPVQAALAPLAASHGKHLLLEKPLALTPEDAGRIVQAVDAAGVAAVIFFTRVFTLEVEQSIQDLAARGPWMRCAVRYHTGALRPGTPYTGSLWRQTSGALWDIGPHALSILLPTMGPVAEVAASLEADLVRLRLTHAPGGISDVTLTLHAPPEESSETYAFRNGAHTASLEMAPAPRITAYRAAVAAVLAAAAGRREGLARHGVAAAAEITRILHAAETRTVSA